MPKIAQNKNLHQAKNAKKDEFYTQLSDIENELKHYKAHFKNKVVYCNCDDPRMSNFFHYFSYNFEDLGLKNSLLLATKTKIEICLANTIANGRFIWNTMVTKTTTKHQTLKKLVCNSLKAMAILEVPRA